MGQSVTSLVLAILLASAQLAHAGSVTLRWNANAEADLAGYKLYYGERPRSQAPYSQTILIQDRTATARVLTLPAGSYYFALTAFDSSGNESGFSSETTARVDEDLQPPGKPGRPEILP
ncbi:MAG: fibronectin type III domain-containing protein [bacterium]